MKRPVPEVKSSSSLLVYGSIPVYTGTTGILRVPVVDDPVRRTTSTYQASFSSSDRFELPKIRKAMPAPSPSIENVSAMRYLTQTSPLNENNYKVFMVKNEKSN